MSKQAQVIGIECTSPPQIYAVQKSPQICIDQKEEQGTILRQSLIVLNFLFKTENSKDIFKMYRASPHNK